MQEVIFQKVDVPGTLLGEGPLWFNSCKRPPPVRDHSAFAFWVVAYGKFDCTPEMSQNGFLCALEACLVNLEFSKNHLSVRMS